MMQTAAAAAPMAAPPFWPLRDQRHAAARGPSVGAGGGARQRRGRRSSGGAVSSSSSVSCSVPLFHRLSYSNGMSSGSTSPPPGGDGVAVVGQRQPRGAVEEQHALRHDFGPVFSFALRGVPGARLESAFHVYFTSLLEELAALLGQLAPGDDGEPLGLFLALAVAGRCRCGWRRRGSW